MWDLKDITPGDTSAYFYFANYWFDSFRVNIAWSPYTPHFMDHFFSLHATRIWRRSFIGWRLSF
jgi:hypothetical protein